MSRSHPNRVVSAPRRPRFATPATILLVEDAEHLRNLYQQALELDGHTVLAATAGPHALQIAEERADPVDLLLTDLVMPGMGGLELAQRLRAVVPAVKVLYISGHADEKTLATREPGAGVLRKPVAIDDLRATVQELLHRSRPE